MNMWLMYLVLKLDDVTQGLQCISIIALVILGIAFAVMVFVKCSAKSDGDDDLLNAIDKPKAMAGKLLIVAMLLLSIGIVLPTTKQAAAIYFVPKVINNKEIHKMPNKLVTLANDWMDEQIKSIKGAK